MAKNEAKTDLWVHELLQEANIHLTRQGFYPCNRRQGITC